MNHVQTACLTDTEFSELVHREGSQYSARWVTSPEPLGAVLPPPVTGRAALRELGPGFCVPSGGSTVEPSLGLSAQNAFSACILNNFFKQATIVFHNINPKLSCL